ncbi:MAG: hypothetical protein EON51_16225, partial [Acinetobacter sp.]
TRREMFAAGWQNEQGGWEVRNAYFKGCLGKKAMSFIPGNPECIVLFEGMMDFLTWKRLSGKNDASILILNSLSFLNPAIQRIKDYHKAEIFFDHDRSGRNATKEILKNLPYCIDSSQIYQGFNDFNEKLQSMLNEQASVSKACLNQAIFINRNR